MNRFRINLRWKLAGVLTLVVVIVMGVSSVVDYARQKDYMLASVEKHFKELSATILAAIPELREDPIPVQIVKRIDTYLNGREGSGASIPRGQPSRGRVGEMGPAEDMPPMQEPHPHNYEIFVLDTRGNVIASNIPSTVGKTMAHPSVREVMEGGKSFARGFMRHGHHMVLATTYAIRGRGEDDRVEGALHISRPLLLIDEELSALINRKIAISGITTFVLVALVLWLASRLVVRPIKELAEKVERVREGDLDLEIPRPSGDEVGMLALSFSDMMRRIRTQTEELRRSADRYRTLFEEANDAIEVVGRDGRVIDCNSKACALLGYRRVELLGRSFSEIAPSCDQTEFHRSRYASGERVSEPFESVRRRKDGLPVPVEVSGGPIEIQGEPCSIFFVRDITERKRNEQMLVRSQKMAAIGSISAGIVHEVLNPVNIIGLHAQRLIKAGGGPSSASESGDLIYRNVQRISKICNDLRQFYREEKENYRKFDLSEVIREALAVLEPRISVGNVRVSLDLPANPLMLEGEPDRISQVLFNLVNNALDAMPDGGMLTVSADHIRGRDWVRATIGDDGSGIPDESLPRIFDPFFTTKGKEKGTGLGLFIVQSIIETHGGHISVESQVGRGTVFFIELPARANPGAYS